LSLAQPPLPAAFDSVVDVQRSPFEAFSDSMISKRQSGLLIVAHGSTVNPDSSAPTLAHAAEIRRRKVFADVGCAFWKEEPSLRDAIFSFDLETIRAVYVVPDRKFAPLAPRGSRRRFYN